MISLTNLQDVKALQANLKAKPLSDKDNMKFMEQLCGWFDFMQTDQNQILISHGKRQVLATIKTLLECTPEQIVALTHD